MFDPSESVELKEINRNPFINIALDTIASGKQALMFVNSKKRAEKSAEEIAKVIKISEAEKLLYNDLADKALKALSNPTKQCERLSLCLKKGIAFHHSGLVSKQRSLIEENFKEGKIKIICATPTLAAGLDLPAFRVIIRDLMRFSSHGLKYIPVLEYMQQIGRAGRPKYDKYGEAIVICSENEKDYIVENYIFGEPEDIYSKLAVEPILRSYVLSLISTRFAGSRDAMMDFFSRSFWAYQFKDLEKLEMIIERVVHDLKEWGFVEGSDDLFVSADSLEGSKYKISFLGRRVSETYVDPLTAHNIIVGLENANERISVLGLLQLVSHTLEMRPLARVGSKEQEKYEDFYARHEEEFLEEAPSYYDFEYEEFLNSLKTAKALFAWIEEKDEEYIYEEFGILPGELKAKIDIADWLLYSAGEFANVLRFKSVINEINKLRLRLKHGVKEELLALVRLKQIGRVRARKLYDRGFTSLKELRKADLGALTEILGRNVAIALKRQLNGEDYEEIEEPQKKLRSFS